MSEKSKVNCKLGKEGMKCDDDGWREVWEEVNSFETSGDFWYI